MEEQGRIFKEEAFNYGMKRISESDSDYSGERRDDLRYLDK